MIGSRPVKPPRQGNFQLLPPAPPYYPFPRGKSILGVLYGVLLWAAMNAETPLGARGRSVIDVESGNTLMMRMRWWPRALYRKYRHGSELGALSQLWSA